MTWNDLRKNGLDIFMPIAAVCIIILLPFWFWAWDDSKSNTLKNYEIIEIKGHAYIKYYRFWGDQIIHAEHCKCGEEAR